MPLFPCLAMHALCLGRAEGGMAVCHGLVNPVLFPEQPLCRLESAICMALDLGTQYEFALAAKLVLTASLRQV